MPDRSRAIASDAEVLEETPPARMSEAETAPCTCPELCIRDHEHE